MDIENRTEIEKIASIIESLLFITDKPLTLERLQEVIEVEDVQLLKQGLEFLKQNYAFAHHGVELIEVAGGYQLRTIADNALWVLRFQQAKPQRLSRAALETLAVVAYKQPITRPELEEIRGVDSGGVLKTLLEKNLVRILGKKDEAGNPLIYGTTEGFLSFFGIKSLRDLPSLRDYQQLKEQTEPMLPLEQPIVESPIVDSQ